jgi:hypothetical protein
VSFLALYTGRGRYLSTTSSRCNTLINARAQDIRGTKFLPCLSRRLAWPFLAVIIPRDVLTYTWPVVHGKAPLVVTLFYASSGALAGLLLTLRIGLGDTRNVTRRMGMVTISVFGALDDSPISGVINPAMGGYCTPPFVFTQARTLFPKTDEGGSAVCYRNIL